MRSLNVAILTLGVGYAGALSAATDNDLAGLAFDPTQISFDELINTTITSVSKKEERLQDAAAAIFVLTNADIRRAHVTTIPDALRLVPGTQVNQADNGSYTVSTRGFGGNIISANKLLVLIDGRSVYNPLFGGVIWEAQSVVMEDIDRIEVIRGPGGTLWGSNAVNGVINIITKEAKNTQGNLLLAGTGNEDRAIGVFRHGGELGDRGYYRVYGKHQQRGQSFNSGANASDDFRNNQGGFRADFSTDAGNHTLQGDYYDNAHGAASGGGQNTHYYGGNLLYRIERQLDEQRSYSFQTYWDYTQLDTSNFEETRDTLDFDFQYHFDPEGMHDLVWGLNYRYVGDNATSAAIPLVPAESEDTTISGFIQDEMNLSEDLSVILGTKLEENDYSGFEFQPTARFSYQYSQKQTFWGAVSKAVRIPTRLEGDINLAIPAAGVTIVSPNRSLDAEELWAYELGYRSSPTSVFNYDLTAYLHDYDSLIVFERDSSLPPNPALPNVPPFPIKAQNGLKGKTWGLELSSKWQVREWWLLDTTFTFLQQRIDVKDGHNGLTGAAAGVNQATSLERGDPAHRATVFSKMDLDARTEFDAILRYADNIYGSGGAGVVPSYVELDLGLTFKPRRDLSLEIAGRNLLDSHHREVIGAGANEIQRSVHGTVTWKF